VILGESIAINGIITPLRDTADCTVIDIHIMKCFKEIELKINNVEINKVNEPYWYNKTMNIYSKSKNIIMNEGFLKVLFQTANW
jgi:hypothetical protein